MPWRLTVRAEHRVARSSFDDLGRALDALEARGRELAAAAPREAVDVKIKQFTPAEQVSARLELAGPERWFPSVRTGVDLRGDGSATAFRGAVRRVELEQRSGEDAFGALRRALDDVLEAAGS
jgi:hypothetical protein